MGRLIAILLLLGQVLPAAAGDHGQVRALREAGQILPLQELLKQLAPEERVLEVELERSDGRYIYEIEVLDADGEVSEYRFDARTGERLATEGDD